jgi:two-component system sensor histidine kinase KdpD
VEIIQDQEHATTRHAPATTPIWRYAAALLVTAAITIGMLFVEPTIEPINLALCYLLGVLAIATTAGLGPGILTSLLSFLAFNFFFVPPLYAFHVEDPQNVLRLVTFLIVAVIASGLAGRARNEAETARRSQAETAELYKLSQAISAQVDLEQILPTIAETTCRLLQVPLCTVLLYDEAGCLCERAAFGRSDPRLTAINAFMRDGSTILGVLRVVERTPGESLNERERRLLDTLAAQARLAIDRARLVGQAAHTQALAESDQLKSALISSVSHDLRTPLALIKGAVSTLLADDVAWDTATQRTLAQTIDSEADRLNRIVGNLLDISRIEAGALPIERDWQDLGELIGSVLQRMAPQLAGRPLAVDLSTDLPLVAINATLMDQIFTNLLENAIRYTPPGTPIAIAARRESGNADRAGIVVCVRDRGPGVPPGNLARIFDKFYRAPASGSVDGGSGLGLAICKGMVQAHGGRIWAENSPDGGAIFTFTLPQPS